MKILNLNQFNESINADKWVAIEIVTADRFTDKNHTSSRVVSYDTYQEMKETGYTKSGVEIISVEALSSVCHSKDEAMAFLPMKEKTVKKGKIDKKGADYIVWVISSGKANSSGKTSWGWSIWDEIKDGEIYLTAQSKGSAPRALLFGTEGSLNVDDTIYVVDNDSQKNMFGAGKVVVAKCKCTYQDFCDMMRNEFPAYCKRPSRQFGKLSDGLPWKDLGQMYSIKGIAEEA